MLKASGLRQTSIEEKNARAKTSRLNARNVSNAATTTWLLQVVAMAVFPRISTPKCDGILSFIACLESSHHSDLEVPHLLLGDYQKVRWR